MPLSSFKIQNQKAIRLAQCDKVPSIMVISGPNGVGKSTLLYAIKRKQGDVRITGQVMYILPHRAYRRQTIRMQHLWGPQRSFAETLSGDNLQRIEGINIGYDQRSPDSSDESMNYMKYILSQLETRRSNAIAEAVDKNNFQYPTGVVPDVYLPLKELTRILLPHLEFSRIDVKNRDDVKCLWKRASGAELATSTYTEIDIDELSSGEKAIISLFLPFIERQIGQLIAQIEGRPASDSQRDLVVLIDEPELHLHPALQARMLDYLRKLVGEGGLQFVVTTHSTTILNAANDDELYLLAPKPDWPDPSNQLLKLVDDYDRLEAMRLLAGETYPLTACRAIVCIEGEVPRTTYRPSDKRILEILSPELLKTITVPMGGASVVVDGTRRLREIVPGNIPGLNVFALVDNDQETSKIAQNDDWVFKLPVCMLENLLLVPDSIFQFLLTHLEKAPFKTKEEVETALREIAGSLRDEEIMLRVQSNLKQPERRHISGVTLGAVKEKHAEVVSYVQTLLPDDDKIKEVIDSATKEVDKTLNDKQELKLFRGKRILNEFYKKYCQELKYSFLSFCVEISKVVSKDGEALKELKLVISHLNAYIPNDLKENLQDLKRQIATSQSAQVQRDELISRIEKLLVQVGRAIDERRKSIPVSTDRSSLRKELLLLTHAVDGAVGSEAGTQEILTRIRLSAQKIGNPIEK